VAPIADGAVNHDFTGHGSQAGQNLLCQDRNMSACRRLALCRQMRLEVRISLYVVLLVLLMIIFGMSAAVSGSPWAFLWRLSIIVGLVERIHIDSRRVKVFYGTIPAKDSVLVKSQRLI
jgi:hypothetical protein